MWGVWGVWGVGCVGVCGVCGGVCCVCVSVCACCVRAVCPAYALSQARVKDYPLMVSTAAMAVGSSKIFSLIGTPWGGGGLTPITSLLECGCVGLCACD